MATFDVICAGEALWHLATSGGLSAAADARLRFVPGGGAVASATALARRGLRVGLATALADDAAGRRLRARVASAGVDVGGVRFVAPQRGIVFLDGKGADRQVASYRDEEQPVEIPEAWAASVLLVAGLSPVVANAAALCKAARAARRRGTIVVVDVSARWHLWAGRDPRAVNTQLREADVVHATGEDLAALDLDEAKLRGLVRPTTVLVVSGATGDARATGPFGAVDRRGRAEVWTPSSFAPEVFPAAICAMLARRGEPCDHKVDVWAEALADGLAALA